MIVRMELHRESLSMFKVGGKKVHEQHDNLRSLSGNTNNLFSFGIKNILINAGLPRDICDELLSFHHGSTQLVTHLALLFSFFLFSVLLWIHVDLKMWSNKLKHAAANGSRHHTTVSFRRYKSAIWKKKCYRNLIWN